MNSFTTEDVQAWADSAQRRLVLAMFLLLAVAGCSRKLSQAQKAEQAAPTAQGGGSQI